LGLSELTTARDIDGRISQGWGGSAPNGVHVNVILARRGSPTAAAMTGAFTAPSPGFTPIVVCTGIDQPSYQTVLPPTIMLNKMAPASEFVESLIYGAAQVGIAQAVLDSVAEDLLAADQESVVFVSLWLDADADDETAVRDSARQATRAAIREAVGGRDPAAAQRLVDSRDKIRHPFYHGH
jgi:5,6,7,8-tetrahydromethanopterin hydro-lyase